MLRRKHITQGFNPVMQNVEKWPNILFKKLWCERQRFLKYVSPFFNVIHERVLPMKAFADELFECFEGLALKGLRTCKKLRNLSLTRKYSKSK